MPKPFTGPDRLFTRLAITWAGIGRCCNYSTNTVCWPVTFPHCKISEAVADSDVVAMASM